MNSQPKNPRRPLRINVEKKAINPFETSLAWIVCLLNP